MIVTISREYGAAGLAVADGVAHALGYEMISDDLSASVAAKLGTSAAEVSQIAAAEPSLPERLLGGLGEGTVEVVSPRAPRLSGDFDESVRRELETEIRGYAARGNVVILGRHGGAILGARPDLIRVFLCGALDWRVARIVASFGHARADALADIERIDAARKKSAKERYKTAWSDARSYDLTIDVSRVGISTAIGLVATAVRTGDPAT